MSFGKIEGMKFKLNVTLVKHEIDHEFSQAEQKRLAVVIQHEFDKDGINAIVRPRIVGGWQYGTLDIHAPNFDTLSDSVKKLFDLGYIADGPAFKPEDALAPAKNWRSYAKKWLEPIAHRKVSNYNESRKMTESQLRLEIREKIKKFQSEM